MIRHFIAIVRIIPKFTMIGFYYSTAGKNLSNTGDGRKQGVSQFLLIPVYEKLDTYMPGKE